MCPTLEFIENLKVIIWDFNLGIFIDPYCEDLTFQAPDCVSLFFIV